MKWYIVKGRKGTPVGALGVLNDQVAVISSFYEDKDWDMDGKVSFGERVGSLFTMKNRGVAEVVCRAYEDPEILMNVSGLTALRGKVLTDFARGLIAEGVYITYFNLSVSQVAGSLAGAITTSPIKYFVLKKGMEKAVKEFYLKSVQ